MVRETVSDRPSSLAGTRPSQGSLVRMNRYVTIDVKLILADLFICINAVLRIRQELDHSKGWIGSGIISIGFVITNNKIPTNGFSTIYDNVMSVLTITFSMLLLFPCIWAIHCTSLAGDF